MTGTGCFPASWISPAPPYRAERRTAPGNWRISGSSRRAVITTASRHWSGHLWGSQPLECGVSRHQANSLYGKFRLAANPGQLGTKSRSPLFQTAWQRLQSRATDPRRSTVRIAPANGKFNFVFMQLTRRIQYANRLDSRAGAAARNRKRKKVSRDGGWMYDVPAPDSPKWKFGWERPLLGEVKQFR